MPSSPARTELLRMESVMLAFLSAPRHSSTGCTACRYPLGAIGTCSRRMDVPHGFNPTLFLALNLAGTFVFGLSGGLAAVRAKVDLFGVIVLAAVVGLAGGITRDLLIGTPPATFRDWRYLAAAGAAGLVCYFARPGLERIQRGVLIFDALGLGLFCVTGATKALDFGVGP